MKIRLLKGLLLLGAFICFGAAHAQTVSGTVSDANGPLPGASVLVKGTTNGTQTDFDGNYTLNGVDGDATIVFSYIGFKTMEVGVNGRSTINVTLEEDAQALDEVVIIGYGTTTVKDATGSVTSVTAEDFNTGVISSPEQLIQGKTAGVNIQQTSGEPGAGIQVNIRGSRSVRGDNNPLFVIDGIPIAGGNTDADGTAGEGAGSGSQSNPLAFLNPSDIESMTVLKDASATAIYGARGANGVIIINTKSGKAGSGGVFEFSSNLSIASPVRKFDLLNRDEYLQAVTDFGGNAAANDFGGNTDWQEFILRSTASTNNNIAYSQNYGSGNIRATFGYQKQFGVVETSEFERITGRINWNQRLLDDKLILGVQATIARVNQERPPTDASAGFRGDILGAAYSANPTWPANPGFDDGGGLILPANYLANTQNVTNTNRFLINGTAEYKFTSEFSGKVAVGLDQSDSDNVSVLSPNLFNFNGIEGLGFGTYRNLQRQNETLTATLNYKKEFANSNLDVLVGYEYQSFRTFGFNSEGRGFGTTELNNMSQDLVNVVDGASATIDGDFQGFGYGTNNSGLIVTRLFPEQLVETIPFGFGREVSSIGYDSFDNTDEIQSVFTRINYTLANKYLFTATIRRDGSTQFGPNNKYGNFPSGAFAWKINEEDFVGDNVSTLKLRLSAGATGSQGIGYGNFANRIRNSGIGTNETLQVFPENIGNQQVAFDNRDLKWQTDINYNAGLDFGLNNDRFRGSIDVYRSITDDLLLQLPPAFPSTSEFQFGNFEGNILNQGVEFAIGYDFAQTEDFNFGADFNIAYNFNEVQNFAGAINTGEINGPGLSGAFAQRLEEGQSLFSYYMAIFEGFDANGNPVYQDVDGNGVGDPDADKTFVGEDGLPDITAGLNLTASYKNWDVSAFFTGQFGFSVYNNTANALFNAGQIGTARNITRNVLTEGENPGASTAVSTRFLESGDFVRFQNATIGYNVPLKDGSAFKSLRLSVNGQNLFLVTDYTGVDPEVTVPTASLGSGIPTRGVDWSAFPNPRIITLGVNATF
ncbi:Outer membrane protein [Croceitalea dokdonensis DOKDO 023]|uniref:Outer membrane protein n=1 Tax=Croceitalea dokdonensis DOKDO 023 TaxID=1300341 RepID=A0A0N8H495_9FLAO|nr:SusC/RagA family TonB-linked outer membrane protein [Croceitalea dokdonensis]KPM32748.1 Outer membrane protein [Croceitalea dokdonensis DOKDO 023]